MRKPSRLVWIAAVLVALLALPVAAEARPEVTLSYSGTFTAPTTVSTVPFVVFTTDQLTGTGTGSPPLRRFTAVYPHLVNFAAGTFDGVAVFTGHSGDRLVMRLGGSGAPSSPTTYDVTFAGTVLGGTGRFEDASGSFSGPGTVDLSVLTVAATLTGTIRTR